MSAGICQGRMGSIFFHAQEVQAWTQGSNYRCPSPPKPKHLLRLSEESQGSKRAALLHGANAFASAGGLQLQGCLLGGNSAPQ